VKKIEELEEIIRGLKSAHQELKREKQELEDANSELQNHNRAKLEQLVNENEAHRKGRASDSKLIESL